LRVYGSSRHAPRSRLSRFESSILSNRSRFTCECNKEDINDDDDGTSESATRPVPRRSCSMLALSTAPCKDRDFFIDNLLVRIHFIIAMIRWTGLAPWEFEFLFSGSLTFTFLVPCCNMGCVLRDWGLKLMVSGFRLRVSGSGFLVLDFRVSGFGFRVSGFGCRVSGFRSRGWYAGCSCSLLRPEKQTRPWIRASGFGRPILVSEFRVSGFGFRV